MRTFVERKALAASPVVADVHVPDLDPLVTYHRTEIHIDAVVPFWERFISTAELEDKTFARDNKLSFDTLSIFAILFAAIDTAFILESLRIIQLDRTEKANDIIRLVIHQIREGLPPTEASLLDEAFYTEPRTSRSNALFFLSLCCSLIAASTSIMGKQWLKHYEREGLRAHSATKLPPAFRARQRQILYDSRTKRNLDRVIQSLPTIIQLALFLFFVGLMDFVMPRHVGLALIVMAFSVISLALYIFTTILGFMHPFSPYQTQLSILASKLWKSIHQPSFRKPLIRLLHTHPVQRWPGILISHIIVFLQPHQPLSTQPILDVPHHQSSPTSAPQNSPITQYRPESGTDDLINLSCIISYMKKIKTSQDTAVLLAAMDSLPKGLELDPDHPLLASLAEVMVHFLLRPRLSDHKVEWGNVWIDFRQMLKVLHFLYVRSDYLHDNLALIASSRIPRSQRDMFVHQFEKTIQSEMWAVFSRDPLNIDSVTLISEIMESATNSTPSPTSSSTSLAYTLATSSLCSETDLELLTGCLKSRAQNCADYLPYIKLFAHDAMNRGSVTALAVAGYGVGTEYALLSSMWLDGKPDLDFRRGWLRMSLLPPLRVGENTLQLPFSRYMLQWLRAHILRFSDESLGCGQNRRRRRKLCSGDTRKVFSCYALAICTLSPSTSWVRQLEMDRHPAFLAGLIHGYHRHPRLRDDEGVDDGVEARYSGSGTALLSFITLWHARWTTSISQTEKQDPYFTTESVSAVVHFLISGECKPRPGLLGEFDLVDLGNDRLCEMMEQLASYLEEASRLSLLPGREMLKVVEGFKGLGSYVSMSCIPEQGLELKQLMSGLYERVGRLTMLLE